VEDTGGSVGGRTYSLDIIYLIILIVNNCAVSKKRLTIRLKPRSSNQIQRGHGRLVSSSIALTRQIMTQSV
jgi:hypothetical protein